MKGMILLCYPLNNSPVPEDCATNRPSLPDWDITDTACFQESAIEKCVVYAPIGMSLITWFAVSIYSIYSGVSALLSL